MPDSDVEVGAGTSIHDLAQARAARQVAICVTVFLHYSAIRDIFVIIVSYWSINSINLVAVVSYGLTSCYCTVSIRPRLLVVWSHQHRTVKFAVLSSVRAKQVEGAGTVKVIIVFGTLEVWFNRAHFAAANIEGIVNCVIVTVT